MPNRWERNKEYIYKRGEKIKNKESLYPAEHEMDGFPALVSAIVRNAYAEISRRDMAGLEIMHREIDRLCDVMTILFGCRSVTATHQESASFCNCW